VVVYGHGDVGLLSFSKEEDIRMSKGALGRVCHHWTVLELQYFLGVLRSSFD
jgi:hypothetical protein